jgi:hypothetical protein
MAKKNKPKKKVLTADTVNPDPTPPPKGKG